uniref:Uncharacterized protein n=1 Tax=Lepeophtheirus salmonis TaxID=72036 RepID=A0A0K2T6T3_LEPSM
MWDFTGKQERNPCRRILSLKAFTLNSLFMAQDSIFLRSLIFSSNQVDDIN